MNKQNGYVLSELLFVVVYTAFIFGCIIGWVMNIVKLVAIIGGDVTGMMILRAVGIIVAPLGVVLGYM